MIDHYYNQLMDMTRAMMAALSLINKALTLGGLEQFLLQVSIIYLHTYRWEQSTYVAVQQYTAEWDML